MYIFDGCVVVDVFVFVDYNVVFVGFYCEWGDFVVKFVSFLCGFGFVLGC